MKKIFLGVITESSYNHGFSKQQKANFLKDAEKDFTEHYDKVELTDTQAKSLAKIYIALHFHQESYLEYNKMFVNFKNNL